MKNRRMNPIFLMLLVIVLLLCACSAKSPMDNGIMQAPAYGPMESVENSDSYTQITENPFVAADRENTHKGTKAHTNQHHADGKQCHRSGPGLP